MTPTLLSAFWIYILTTATTPGPNNTLALSFTMSHGLRQSTRVLAGMSLGFLIVMLLCAGISFSLVVIGPAAAHLLSWAGTVYIVWLARKIATSPIKEGGLQTKPTSLQANFASQLVNAKIILYGVAVLSTFVLPQTQALSWVVGVSVLLAIIGTFGNVCQALAGHLFQRSFRQYGRQLDTVLALLLVYCAVHIFYQRKKAEEVALFRLVTCYLSLTGFQ